jgi:hypothetical protein
MNDDNLRRNLRQLRVPEASGSARARARHRALIAFQQPDSSQAKRLGLFGAVWNWRTLVGGSVIVAVVAFVAPRFPSPLNPSTSPDFVVQHHRALESVTNDRQILQQVEKLFPHQVNAVVEKDGKVDLSIAQAPVVGSDQPVLVVFNRGHESIRVLSYSGHRVCLMLGEKQSCFEILATPTGGVILEGEKEAWLASEHPQVAGYSVRAQALEASL